MKKIKMTNRQTMVYKSLHRNKYQETHKTGYIQVRANNETVIYWNLPFLHYVVIVKTKVLLPQA